MGGYHGKASFDASSRAKSVLAKSNWLDFPIRHPPYGYKLGLVRMRLKPGKGTSFAEP